jgi:hypothetical protein
MHFKMDFLAFSIFLFLGLISTNENESLILKGNLVDTNVI